MICSRCGASMSDDQIFCLECGHEIIYVPVYNVEEDLFSISDIFNEETLENDTLSDDKSNMNNDNSKDDVPNNKKRRNIIITSLIILLIVIGFVTYHLVTSYSFDFQYNKALAAIENKDYKSAEGYARRAAELDINNSKALLTFIRTLLANENYEEAHNAIKVLIDKDASSDMYETIFLELINAKDYNYFSQLLLDMTDEALINKYQQYLVMTPKFNFPGGNYSREIRLQITTDSKADIYFSLDGSDPLKGNLYKGEISLNKGEYEIRAVAVNSYNVSSQEKSASFRIDPKAPEMPVIKATDKVVTKDSKIILECQKGCTMYYTWDGTTPSPNSAEYKGPIDIPKGNNVIAVIAVDDYGQMSSVAKMNFILNENVEE